MKQNCPRADNSSSQMRGVWWFVILLFLILYVIELFCNKKFLKIRIKTNLSGHKANLIVQILLYILNTLI